MYEDYAKIRDSLGLKDAEVAKMCGLTRSTFSDWKSGRSTPKDEKMQKIADALGTTKEYLRTGKDDSSDTPYYINRDSAELAQFLFDNPDYKVLFDASRNVKKEDIQFVKDLLDRFNSKNDN